MKMFNNDQTHVKEVKGGPQGTVRLHDYFGVSAALVDGPQAYLVQQVDPHSRVWPHFHDVDQFQIVAQGNGHMGKEPIAPYSIHYSDGYMPYGPIIAGDNGVSYFTIRAIGATGNWKMPGNRDKIPRRSDSAEAMPRHFTMPFDTSRPLPAEGKVVREVLWGPAADGLAVTGLWMGKGAKTMSEKPAAPGCYVLVCRGSVSYQGQTYVEKALGLLESNEQPVELVAGAEGAQLMFMQFPAPSDRPGSRLEHRSPSAQGYVLPDGVKVN